MSEASLTWIQFVVSGAVIVFAGTRLSQYGDMIAEKTGLTRNWVGLFLLAMITSLPELVASSSASVIGAPDIAMGNIFGSNLFNLMILVVLDFMCRRSPMLLRTKANHILTASFGILLSGIAAASILFYSLAGRERFPRYSHFYLGWEPLLILVIYLWSMRLIFVREKKLETTAEEAEELKYSDISKGRCYSLFTLYAAMIVFAGIRLTQMAEVISRLPLHLAGKELVLGQTLVGIILVAIVTSLPELVVSIGAFRLGALDMAVGNMLGSNMFNLLIVPIAGLLFVKGPILMYVSINHVVTALLGIVIAMVVILALKIHSTRTLWGTAGVESWVMLLIYLAGNYLIFKMNLTLLP